MGGRYDLIWTHQPICHLIPTRDAGFWSRVIVTFHITYLSEYMLTKNSVYPRRLFPYHFFMKTFESRFYTRLNDFGLDILYIVVSPHLRDEISSFGIRDARDGPEDSQ